MTTKVSQTPTPAPKSSSSSKVHQKKDLKGDLERQLKLTFSSTKYYEDINVYMKQADKAKTTADAYANWLKAYSFVAKAYTDTKKGESRTVLPQLIVYQQFWMKLTNISV